MSLGAATAPRTKSTYQVAVDTGGTFTDIAIAGPDGRVFVWKVQSDPGAPDQAVVQGVTEALHHVGTLPGAVTRFVHGTTVATNALLTHSGARVGLVTTKGFRDVLAIGYQTRPEIYDLSARRPTPLVERSRTWEVNERTTADGSALIALDKDEIRALSAEIRALECDVVIVSFLNSYANPNHEQQCTELLMQEGVAPHVFAATSISAEMREYERTSTAVLNGYVQPAISSYVERLENRLTELEFGTQLWIMQSNGGLLSARGARDESVRTILSGLAGGVIGAAQWAKALGLPRVVSFDIGGTSTDIALIRDGRPDVMTGGEFAGYAVRLPAVDVHSIGAGGGSIAWLDAGGGLRVGPQSAGAVPGPVCYGHGGQRLTVTDAHFLLGRLGETLLDGRLKLQEEGAREHLEAFARQLGMDPDATAAGILQVITATMARGVRKVSIERGVDIRECELMAFGGAGPLHAGDLVRELGMKGAVIPPHPGIASAVGMLGAPVRRDFAANIADSTADPDDLERIAVVLGELAARANEFADSEAIARSDLVQESSVDARYVGQSYELAIPFSLDVEKLRSNLDDAHYARYGYADAEASMECITARLTVTLPTKERPAEPLGAIGYVADPVSSRRAYFDGAWRDTPIYRREHISSGCGLTGPLIIEQLDTTIVVLPGQECILDSLGFIHIRELETS